MEISSIDKIQISNKITKKEAIPAARIEDTFSISYEAQKKAEWVEKLKQMPDIRPEKIKSALCSDVSHQSNKIFSEVARQILLNS